MKTDETTSKLVSTRPYQGFSLAQAAPRPDSLAIFDKPSRYGNNLRHPDENRRRDLRKRRPD
jgi:hypothetical protein